MTRMHLPEPELLCCDFSNPDHLNSVAALIDHYMADPMGDSLPLTALQKLRLVDGLANHPTAIVLLAFVQEQAAGLVVAFENFSTFRVKPFIYVHDVVVHSSFRGHGIGRKMMAQIIGLAQERGCCKVTLEVRCDNEVAQALYTQLGFESTHPAMLYWEKKLT